MVAEAALVDEEADSVVVSSPIALSSELHSS